MRNLLKENLLTVCMIIHTWNDTYRTILIVHPTLFHMQCQLDVGSTWSYFILLWWDIWRPLLPHACVISSKLRGIQTYNLDTSPNLELPKITRPNSFFLSSINIQSTWLLSYLILQHLHTQRYGLLLIDEVVVIYKHIVWFTYSRSYLHTLQYQLRIPDGLVSCIHPCKVLSSIHRTIKCLTSSLARQSTSSLVYHTIYRFSEVEHIICTKDTARLLISYFVWFHMPCAHTQPSQTRSSPLSGDTFLLGKCHTNYTSSCDRYCTGGELLTLQFLLQSSLLKFWLRLLQNKHIFKPHHIHISLILLPVSVAITWCSARQHTEWFIVVI